VVAIQLNAKRKYTKHWYTTITAVHNIHSGAQHMHTFGLPEGQVASTTISVLICLHISARGSGKGHEETLC